MRLYRGVLIGLACLLLGVILVDRVPRGLHTRGGDFANYHVASRLARAGVDLTPAYRSFPWFQDAMDREGYAGQLGSFLPFPPETALLLWPIAPLPPHAARAVWTILQLAMLTASAVFLARLARAPLWVGVLLLALSGVALDGELKQGQAYLLLVTVISGGLVLLDRRRMTACGLVWGLLLPLKYAAAPLVLIALARGRWRVALSALAAAMLVTAIGVLLLGVRAHEVFLLEVLPRHLRGEIQHPYLSVFQSFPVMFRRLFVAEPSLNPSPWIDSPRLFVLAREATRFLLLSLLALPVVWSLRAARRKESERPAYVLALLWVLVGSPAGATYHALLALPAAALLLRDARPKSWDAALVLAAVGAIGLPWALWLRDLDHGAWTPLAHGRLWILVALSLVAIGRYRAMIPRAFFARWSLASVAAAALLALLARPPVREPGVSWLRTEEPIRSALILDRLERHGDQIEVTAISGASYERFVVEDAAPILTSELPSTADRGLQFSPELLGAVNATELSEAGVCARSASGARAVLSARRGANWDLWLYEVGSTTLRRLTWHPARDTSPVFRDEQTVLFLSDRERGIACPTIYRLEIPEAR